MSKPVELLKQKTDNIEEKLETVVSRPLIPRADFIELKRLFALAFDTNGLVSHECQFIQNQNDQIDTSVIDATINKAVD